MKHSTNMSNVHIFGLTKLAFMWSTVSLPPDQVSQGVKKSKSSLGAGLAVLPPPFAPKLHQAGIPQSQSLGSFPTPLTGEPLRNIQVLPAVPPQRKRSPSPLTTQNLSDNRN
ncbi:hypothetical protein QQF64_002720 [Cirrhinus molitorella]|uniref:Ubinuclein 1 n=1 Tax=Cirrhinus molitorella TaxID=172907 RepID=A0ABR3MQY4_9TELE